MKQLLFLIAMAAGLISFGQKCKNIVTDINGICYCIHLDFSRCPDKKAKGMWLVDTSRGDVIMKFGYIHTGNPKDEDKITSAQLNDKPAYDLFIRQFLKPGIFERQELLLSYNSLSLYDYEESWSLKKIIQKRINK